MSDSETSSEDLNFKFIEEEKIDNIITSGISRNIAIPT